MVEYKIKKMFLSFVFFMFCFFMTREALPAEDIFADNIEKINLIHNMITINSTTMSEELPISRQPISDYEELYNVFVKSEYETQAQYETRIQDFLAKEPLQFFDPSFIPQNSAYDVETQTLSCYSGIDYNIDGISTVNFLIDYESLLDISDTYYNIAITNAAAFGLTNYDSNHFGYIFCTVKMDPGVAQAIRNNLKIRIGFHIPYKPQGIIHEDVGCSSIKIHCDYDDYIIGALAIITLYDSTDNKIYYQHNHIDPSWLPTTTTTTAPLQTTTTSIPVTTSTIPVSTTTTSVEPLECPVNPIENLEGTLWKEINREHYIGFYKGGFYQYFGDTNPEKGFMKYRKLIEFSDHKFLMRDGAIIAFQRNMLGNWGCNNEGCWMDILEIVRLLIIPRIRRGQYELVCSDWSL